MSQLDREVRDSGVLEVLWPVDDLRHLQAVRQVIDEAGRIATDAADPFRTPSGITWAPGEVGRKRTLQAGVLEMIWAHATTPPTATCTVTITMETQQMGVTSIGTVDINAGLRIGETTLNQPVPAGAYLAASVTTAGGASGVSMGVGIRTG